LKDLPRSGRPKKFTAFQVTQIKAIACTSPDTDKKIPLARWSTREIIAQAIRDHIVETISRSTVGRWLAQDIIKPWQTRSWISPRDPLFAKKGAVILDLYQRIWEGLPLGENEYVISADEKPGIQALRRLTPTRPLGLGGSRRVEFDYHRGGTRAYLAGLDVGSGRVMGITDTTTGIQPFATLVDQVMSQKPYKSAEHVYWIVDNGASHKPGWGQMRLKERWPNANAVRLGFPGLWQASCAACRGAVEAQSL
jgi:hypothetical protein